MVRLKASSVTEPPPSLSGFNSNMVRLKVYIITCYTYQFSQFQFQYGAIKRKSEITELKGKLEFQFQYGAIKSDVPSTHILAINPFQFQYGAIKRKTIHENM